MNSSIERNAVTTFVAVLTVVLLVAGAVVQRPISAPATAGPVHASAGTYTFLFETPANGSLLGLAQPVTAIAVGWLDSSGGLPAAAVLYLDGMNLTSAGTLDRATSSYTLPVGFAFRDGPHVVNFTVVDTLGAVGYHNWTFTVDTIPPLLIVTSPVYPMVPLPAVWVNGTSFAPLPVAGPPTVNVTVLPSHVFQIRTANATTGAFSVLMPLTEGLNTLFVNATDKAGNLATQIVPIVRDTTKPLLEVLTPRLPCPQNVCVSPTNLVRIAGLSEFGAFLYVNGYNVLVAPNGTWSVTLALPEGLNIIQIAASDTVGNVNATGFAVFVDSDVPTITLTSPTSDVSTKSQVVVAGTVTDTQVVAFYVNGLPVSLDAAGSFRTTLTLLDGLRPIVLAAVDAAQHTTIVQLAIRVDTTAPTVTVSTPPDGRETSQSTVLIQGTVDDVNATVLVNDAMVRPDASGRWETTVALLPGSNTITVSAVDAVGNRAAVIVRHVDYFSPISDLENTTAANARNLDELGAVVRFSLVGILLLALGVEFMLYGRSAKKLRETRELLEAAAPKKPKT